MKVEPAKELLLKHTSCRKKKKKRAIIYPEMHQESGEACDSQISQVKRSDRQTTAAGQLTDGMMKHSRAEA